MRRCLTVWSCGSAWCTELSMTWLLLQPQNTHTFVIVTWVPGGAMVGCWHWPHVASYLLILLLSSDWHLCLLLHEEGCFSLSGFFSSLCYFPEPLWCPHLFYLPIVSCTSLSIQLFFGGDGGLFSPLSILNLVMSYLPVSLLFSKKFCS